MSDLYNALGDIPGNFSSRVTEILGTFTPPLLPDNSFMWIEILTAISTLLIVGTILTGNIYATAASALFAGAITKGINVLAGSASTPGTNLSITAYDWVDSVQNIYTNLWENTIDAGNESMVSLFEKGVFLDERKIPILTSSANATKITQGQVTDWNLDVLDAAVVNLCWNQANVFLYCYEMSEDDFNNNAADIPPALKAFTSQGYGFSGHRQLPFTGPDIIQSSYSSFVAGGFNYTVPPPDNINTVLAMTVDDILNGGLWPMVGTFNLPICDPSGTWSLEEFFANMGYEGYGDTAR
ncbi:hypothetical protein VTN77DRAFT_7380 [Rasamsonia byssochlamydoides]|uniref:uncharacterized protein n=1 Tax=Rasamsonia byssochlamydoides TaxID=89139 RepID=UPI003742AF01